MAEEEKAGNKTQYVVLFDVAKPEENSTDYTHSIIEVFCTTPDEAYLKAVSLSNITPKDDTKLMLIGVYKRVDLKVVEG